MLYNNLTRQSQVFGTVFAILFSSVVWAENIDPRYENAIADTAVLKVTHQHTLIPLGSGRERFVVWTDYRGYQPNDHYAMPLNLFVTRESEMKAACQKLALDASGDHLKDRINQLLGLPKMDAPQQFVQISMDVEQFNNSVIANYSDSTLGQALFRPCGDPNVYSTQCGLNFANDVNGDFKLWIYQKTRNSYHQSTVDPVTQKINYGYPWTDLGYTYNWGNSINHVGLQEFVVKKGAQVQVLPQSDGTAYVSAQSFCRRI